MRYGGPGKPPVTDGPFAETKDLIAGWMVIDVESEDAGPRGGGVPLLRAGQGRASRSTSGSRCGRSSSSRRRSRTDGPVQIEELLRDLSPQVLGVLVRRGADFAAAEDAVQEALVEAVRRWPDELPAEPKGWLVTVAWRRFLDAQRSDDGPAAPRARPGGRAAARAGRAAGRHAAAALPVLPPVADPGVGGGAHAARRRRPDHPADRRGLPGARGDHGAADQPRQEDARRGRDRHPRRPGHGAQGALPGLQRGLHRRGRPGRGGDPADPAARRRQRGARRSPACSR